MTREEIKKGFFARVDKLKKIYAEMSEVCQKNKHKEVLPLAPMSILL